VLFSADLSQRQKGLDVLLAATVRLLDRMPDVRVQLSGPGDPSWALEPLGPDRRRVADAIDYLGLGDLDDIPGRYRSARVTVLPSTHEAFGLALVESLATGTPVVCSAAGGMPEIVDSEHVGRVVPYGDDAALADAVEAVVDLAGRPATPARCVDHARQWGWVESVGPAHESLYRDVAGGIAVVTARKERPYNSNTHESEGVVGNR
jgi:glycosyltransferase involved in cell wall biosynthesis